MIAGYHLGLPLWGMSAWVGNFYSPGTRSAEFLAEYATVFNAVEGNTTFYQIPSAETVSRWHASTPDGFRFCFKLPGEITHERRLRDAQATTNAFFGRMEPLGERLGPFMVQLPASFAPDGLAVLEGFLRTLPSEFSYAVEVRHRAFFDNREFRRQLNERLIEAGMERVIMDTRAMRSGATDDPDVQRALHDKPDLPVQEICLSGQPLVRFIGSPDSEINDPWLRAWVGLLEGWIGEGRRPFFFVHCPNNLHAPPLAGRFHAMLASALGERVGTLPAAPATSDSKQLGLFS
ncbi:MAG: DUF72 domain-containing protein [Gammaproteobacteria bacterium]|jgi:uncharacterized protein YecE (DUF72 family)